MPSGAAASPVIVWNGEASAGPGTGEPLATAELVRKLITPARVILAIDVLSSLSSLKPTYTVPNRSLARYWG